MDTQDRQRLVYHLGEWERYNGPWAVYRDGKEVVICAYRDSAERIVEFHSQTENGHHQWEVGRPDAS